jgi:hypothetical protein
MRSITPACKISRAADGVSNMNIYPISLGVEHGYIIQGEGVVMIDGGAETSISTSLET